METKVFVYNWNPREMWFSPGFGESEQAARLYFWNHSQEMLLGELSKELTEGWKPVTEVGPASFKVRSYVMSEMTCSAPVMWVITLGIGFLLDLLNGFSSYNRLYYEPVEFRVVLAK